MKTKIERRFYDGEIQLRASTDEESGKKFIEGYAALFNVRSKLFSGKRGFMHEYVNRNAFDNVLADENLDTTFNFQHNDDFIIARTAAGTLDLSVDDVGLKYRAEIPEGVSYAEDLYNLVKTGNIRSNSFAFAAKSEDYSWEKEEDGLLVGKLENVRVLADVSAVVRPVYEGTSLEARSEILEESYDEYIKKEEKEIPETDEWKARKETELKLLKLKLLL